MTSVDLLYHSILESVPPPPLGPRGRNTLVLYAYFNPSTSRGDRMEMEV
jgi:hypothetical protein